jgi:hypothetical protein
LFCGKERSPASQTREGAPRGPGIGFGLDFCDTLIIIGVSFSFFFFYFVEAKPATSESFFLLFYLK